jgi:hypothetical protein
MRNGTADPLHQPTIDLAEQTWRACTGARKAIRTAAELVRTSQAMREQREHWRVLLAERMANPNLFMSCCAYCSRMRTQTQEWVAIPAGVGKLLRDRNVPFLSHGVCPECLDSLIEVMTHDGASTPRVPVS